jgi:hypothetical protein
VLLPLFDLGTGRPAGLNAAVLFAVFGAITV